MWKNSRANPKTPGGVHVTGPPSRVPLWLAPVVLVAVRVSRPWCPLLGLWLRFVAVGHRAWQEAATPAHRHRLLEA